MTYVPSGDKKNQNNVQITFKVSFYPIQNEVDEYLPLLYIPETK